MRASVSSRPSDGDRLEDARRHRGAADGHPHRLEDVLGLDSQLVDHAAQRGLDVLGVERLGRPPARRVPGEALGAPSPITFAQAFSSYSAGARRGSPPAARSRRASASSPGRSHRLARDASRPRRSSSRAVQLVERQLAQVVAVHPAQLLLVEHRRVLRHPLEREALDQLVGGEEGGRLVVAPAEQRDVVAHRLGQIARARGAPAPRPRRGASRASCRRGRAAAAGARTRAARRRRAPRRIISWRGVFEMWSSPRTTCVMPMSWSSTATARL